MTAPRVAVFWNDGRTTSEPVPPVASTLVLFDPPDSADLDPWDGPVPSDLIRRTFERWCLRTAEGREFTLLHVHHPSGGGARYVCEDCGAET